MDSRDVNILILALVNGLSIPLNGFGYYIAELSRRKIYSFNSIEWIHIVKVLDELREAL